MARAPLLQLSDISLTFGGDPVFNDLSLVVQQGDRVALVGRNGSGKSTLMKVMAGLVEADSGDCVVPPGTSVGYMEQEPDMTGFATLGDFAASRLDPSEAYRVEMVAEGLKFDPTRSPEVASGGERRRAALAKLMAEAPELMLLDEPTNHLDIEAIAWLEEELKQTRAAFILISHDRAFLRALTRATLWVDRGQVRRQEQGFEGFEAWRDKVWEDEDMARHKLDRKIKAEARWAVEGISARRKRNQGRVRALQGLREERAGQIRRQGAAAMALDSGPKSGKRVVEAEGISKSFGDKVILSDFSIKVMRGDRVAFVGPNGVGKTTLLKSLMGLVPIKSGAIKLDGQTIDKLKPYERVRLGVGYVPQGREIFGRLTVAENLQMGLASKPGSTPFPEQLFDLFPVLKQMMHRRGGDLSGGQQQQLAIARALAAGPKLLILDEPTEGIQPSIIKDIGRAIRKLADEGLNGQKMAVVLVEQFYDFAAELADQYLVMERGEIIQRGRGANMEAEGVRQLMSI